MKEKKTEKDLSILDSKEVDIETSEHEDVTLDETAIPEAKNNSDVENDEIKAERKKIKPWILIVSIVLILAIVAVGVFTWYNYTTLATYDGGRVTKAEFEKELEATFLAQGITEEILNDPNYAEDIANFKNELLITTAFDEVFYKQLENLNIAQLDSEEKENIENECRTIIDNFLTENHESIIASLPEGYTEEDAQQAIRDFETQALNQIGCKDFRDFVDLKTKNTIYQQAYDILLPEADLAPTDEEVKTEYQSLLDSQVAKYSESPVSYINDFEQGLIEYPLYVPDGIRLVRHILIQIEQTTLDEIITLINQGSQEEADALIAEGLEKIRPDAESVLEQINTGHITFNEALGVYGEDPGMGYYPDGYKTCENYDGFVPEFQEGAMSLDTVGEHTGLVASSYGYHIIEYTGDYTAETVSFEDISEVLYQNLLQINMDTRWQEIWMQWPKDLNLQFKDESLNESVNMPEGN